MSIFRSYLRKNNSLISNNSTNCSQNPVTEISFGTYNKEVSRFIFDVDLDDLTIKINDGIINSNRIVSHTLHLTNTITNAPQYIGKKSYSLNIDRATSFELDFFNIDQDWDEGGGYDFNYNDAVALQYKDPQASNWFERKTGINWTSEGAYDSGSTTIINSQTFNKGNEDIQIDITDYINQRLFGNLTGYTGTTIYTGNSYGIGVKFTDFYESIETEFRQAVAFFTKHTNTYYEPYVETIIDDTITDDRNYFYLDKDNDLYLYSNVGGFPEDVIINNVVIRDHEDNIVATLSGDSIETVSKGIYKITLNVDSESFPDAVIFTDTWSITINNKTIEHEGEFYLISSDVYYDMNQTDDINFNNYHFNFNGIKENEKIKADDSIRKIKISVKELYPNQNNFIPLDLEYRLFTAIAGKYQIDIIPFTKVNRTNKGYEFNLDTSWLIPQDYYLQIRMKNGYYYENKQILSFSIVSDDLTYISK
jgi:hypothetical protein